MAKIHAYLNFNGNCKEAFDFYGKVFKTENLGTYLFDDMPEDPNGPPAPESAKGKVMHTSIKLNDSTMLMGSDIIEEYGQQLKNGNSTYIMIDAESASEATEIHQALSENASVMEMDLAETFFAELFSSFIDKYGTAWMIHFEGNKKMN